MNRAKSSTSQCWLKDSRHNKLIPFLLKIPNQITCCFLLFRGILQLVTWTPTRDAPTRVYISPLDPIPLSCIHSTSLLQQAHYIFDTFSHHSPRQYGKHTGLRHFRFFVDRFFSLPKDPPPPTRLPLLRPPRLPSARPRLLPRYVMSLHSSLASC